jgi:hypothetical protein
MQRAISDEVDLGLLQIHEIIGPDAAQDSIFGFVAYGYDVSQMGPDLVTWISGHAQGLPGFVRKVFGEEDDLASMVRVVGNLPVDCLNHGERLTSDGHSPF